MQKIGIGYENYKEFVEGNLYYVDKTMLVRDLVEKGGKVTLFTRPRRFGKTLALSMLQTFFELEYDNDGKEIDKSWYFEGKKIMGAPKEILSMMGKYPVINLSIKSARQPDFISSFNLSSRGYLYLHEEAPEFIDSRPFLGIGFVYLLTPGSCFGVAET